ncbi:hypothetical protein [Streptomyces nodosus]|uniref:hypothetical protein n=1 Tax=Streptomyces nodosus TaxID=40318 RepID=UPI0036EE7E7D
MKRILGRRIVTAVATTAVAGGVLLGVAGAASAAPNPAAERAVTVSHSNGHSKPGDHRGGRDAHRWDSNHRWDGHRTWYRTGTVWSSYDHGRHYRYDGHHFYRQTHGVWIKVIESPRGFDYGIFR